MEMLEITKMWSDLKPEDKRVFEDTADALKNEYTQNMVKFRNNPAYQRYKRAMIDVSVAAKKQAVAQFKRKGTPAKAASKAAAKKGAASDSDSDVSGCDPDGSSSASSDSD